MTDAIPNRIPTPAEAMCGAHHPVTAMACTKERDHAGEHQSKHGNPWPADATRNRVPQHLVQQAHEVRPRHALVVALPDVLELLRESAT